MAKKQIKTKSDLKVGDTLLVTKQGDKYYQRVLEAFNTIVVLSTPFRSEESKFNDIGLLKSRSAVGCNIFTREEIEKADNLQIVTGKVKAIKPQQKKNPLVEILGGLGIGNVEVIDMRTPKKVASKKSTSKKVSSKKSK